MASPVLRQQLPAYSPLPLRAIHRAARTCLGERQLAVELAHDLLRNEYRAGSALLCDSGRSALQLAIGLALRVVGGRRVVGLPAFQCYEVGSAAVGADCAISLYDIDAVTLGPDLLSLEAILRRETRVVVIAPLFGLPVDWDAVSALCQRFGALAIEDAAQGHGAEWRGRAIGTFGSLSVLSFGRGKGWTAGGGGAVLGRDQFADLGSHLLRQQSQASMLAALRTFFSTYAQALVGRPALYGLPTMIPGIGLGETRYRTPKPPRSVNAYCAALLPETVELSRQEVIIRRANGYRWERDLSVEGWATPIIKQMATPGFLRYPLRLGKRPSIGLRRLGVLESYPATLKSLPAVQHRLLGSYSIPGAELLARELVTLPTHSLLRECERAVILDLLPRGVSSSKESLSTHLPRLTANACSGQSLRVREK